MEIKFKVGDYIEILEKQIFLYNSYIEVSNKITDAFCSEDIDTRRKNPKVALRLLDVMQENLFNLNKSKIELMYTKIYNIVKENHLVFIDKQINSTNKTFSDENDNFYKNSVNMNLERVAEEIKQLFTENNHEPKQLWQLKCVKKVLLYYDAGEDDNSIHITELIADNIFGSALGIRADLSEKANQIEVVIDVND